MKMSILLAIQTFLIGILLVLSGIEGIKALQIETDPPTPEHPIYGIRPGDPFVVETRTSPGSPGIEFVNLRWQNDRAHPNPDIASLQVFMESRTFLEVFWPAIQAYKDAQWPPPGQ